MASEYLSEPGCPAALIDAGFYVVVIVNSGALSYFLLRLGIKQI